MALQQQLCVPTDIHNLYVQRRQLQNSILNLQNRIDRLNEAHATRQAEHGEMHTNIQRMIQQLAAGSNQLNGSLVQDPDTNLFRIVPTQSLHDLYKFAYVYCINNPFMRTDEEHIFKIGRTNGVTRMTGRLNEPIQHALPQRMDDLSLASNGNPSAMLCHHFIICYKQHRVEHALHHLLRTCSTTVQNPDNSTTNLNGSEFFSFKEDPYRLMRMLFDFIALHSGASNAFHRGPSEVPYTSTQTLDYINTNEARLIPDGTTYPIMPYE